MDRRFCGWLSAEELNNREEETMKSKPKKKMTAEERVYEELRQAYGRPRTPLAAPKSPSAMKLFKFFFPTVEDAEIGKCLEAPAVRWKV